MDLESDLQQRLFTIVARVSGLLRVHQAQHGMFAITLFFGDQEITFSTFSLDEAADRLDRMTESITVPPPMAETLPVWVGKDYAPMGDMPLLGRKEGEFAHLDVVILPGWTHKLYARTHTN